MKLFAKEDLSLRIVKISSGSWYDQQDRRWVGSSQLWRLPDGETNSRWWNKFQMVKQIPDGETNWNGRILEIDTISGDGWEKQGIRSGNPFQRHIQGVQQGQWW